MDDTDLSSSLSPLPSSPPQAMVELLQVEAASLAHKVEGLQEECEERSSQANTWYEALKVSGGWGGGWVVGGVVSRVVDRVP